MPSLHRRDNRSDERPNSGRKQPQPLTLVGTQPPPLSGDVLQSAAIALVNLALADDVSNNVQITFVSLRR